MARYGSQGWANADSFAWGMVIGCAAACSNSAMGAIVVGFGLVPFGLRQLASLIGSVSDRRAERRHLEEKRRIELERESRRSFCSDCGREIRARRSEPRSTRAPKSVTALSQDRPADRESTGIDWFAA